MLQQIILRTPAWVWPLLAFLLYRGILASGEREVALRQTLITPLVMCALSVQGTLAAFGLSGVAASLWLLGLALGATAAWNWLDRASIVARPRHGRVLLRGSWQPLMLMMGIFLTKYVVGALLSVQPQLARQAAFASVVCALYGAFSGVFLGRMLRTLALYRAAQAGLAVPAAALDAAAR